MAQIAMLATLFLTKSTNTQTISADVSTCADDNYVFNMMTFTCDKCDLDRVSDKVFGGEGLQCVCAKGSINQYDTTLEVLDPGYGTVTGCLACGAGQAPNRARDACLPCDTATMNVDTPSAGQCTCKESAQIYKDQELSGELLTQITCEACPAGQFPGPGWECDICSNFAMDYIEATSGVYTCDCRNKNLEDPSAYLQAGDSCVPRTDSEDLDASVAGGLGSSTIL